jgi:hypothetical protein
MSSHRRRRPQRKPPALLSKVRRREPVTPLPDTVLLVLLGLLLWVVLMSTQVALAGAATRLAAPRTLKPDDAAAVQAVPWFSWKPVRRAAKYEFQLSADSDFHSVVYRGGFFTRNTYATVPKTLADGDYFWRVRAIDAKSHAGRWSAERSVHKRWGDRPVLLGPADGGTVTYPLTPLVLRWAAVPYAYKYVVTIATDPGLAHSALGSVPSIETSATSLALPIALAPGRYYWAVTPEDADKHPGAGSAVASFDWSWPTRTTPAVTDLNPDPRVYDPRFSWTSVLGAAQYQVEVNSSQDFAVGSRVCCDDLAVGTSMSPVKLLPNNAYYWRVRAIDMDGNAGVWNVGPSFTKTFDEVNPTVPGLRLRDNLADVTPALGASGFPETTAPVLSWNPVPGASSYDLTVAPWEPPGFCDWTQTHTSVPNARSFTIAGTAWTPLGPSAGVMPVGNAFRTVASDGGWHLFDGASYCVRIRARSDRDARGSEVVSDWTQLGGEGHAAFTYSQPAQTCAPASMPASGYLGPTGGSVSVRTPLFTWRSVPGACGYFVVVARDPDFTKIVDVAITNTPAYAPRTGFGATTYPDETTSYYWAVMPTRDANGVGLSTQPQQDFPQAFQKRSTPPALLGPTGGQVVASQPVFVWQPTEGARSYRLQIADDPTFGNPIADVATDSTSYTSTSALPADSTLYWRVRADDENRVGLTWSATGTFRRRFPVPVLTSNPTGGQAIPVLSWLPVDGAVSYDMHVEQADGTKKNFNMRSTAFTPISFYGTGVWHWEVRANFRSGFTTVSGGYTNPLPFAREIATPTAIHTVKANGGAVLTWDPAPQARQYRVQIAADDSFTQIVEEATVSNTSYAPFMLAAAYRNGSRLFWRVATMDEGSNLGGWASAALRAARQLKIRAKGSLRAHRTGTVRVKVTAGAGRGLARAVVRVRGAGVSMRPRRTNRSGRVTLRLTAAAKGKVELTAEKAGYAPSTTTVRVR